MGDAIHVIDKNMKVILFNPALEKWAADLGLKTDIIGKKLNEAFPFLSEKILNEYKQVFHFGEALFTDEITEIIGKTIYTEARKIPIFMEGRVNQIITIIRDISERKIAEQRLKESEEKYRKAYNRADFYKDLFAHDMNNILQNIYSASQLSVMELNDKNNLIKLKENLDIILDQVKRGARLVSNVRKLTRLEESEIKLGPIDPMDILYKSIDNLKNAYQNKDLNINVECEIEKPKVIANNLLEDVFENILINAIKYNENPCIQILIQISKELKANESYIKFEFKDNGIGIDDSRKKDIFLRNHQTEVSHRGMGFGLSLVRKIIANYKGSIWVEDKFSGDYKKGSNFIILIPEVN
jgi:PAS domain S-box-containing protein